MVFKANSKTLRLAIDCLVKDPDLKYDECLVERFLDSIRAYVINASNKTDDTSVSDNRWFKVVKPIFEQLKKYQEHEAFVMLNRPRIFKIFVALLKDELEDDDFTLIIPYMDTLWNTMPSIIVNNDQFAIRILITLWERQCCKSESYNWLVNKKIDPPIRIVKQQEYTIDHVGSLATFYIETSNNYHTRNRAENLLETLIIQSSQRRLQPDHWQHCYIRDAIRSLMLKNNPSIFSIIKHLNKVVISRSDRDNFFERYELRESLEQSFIDLSQSPKNIVQLCKCIAVVADWIEPSEVMKRLLPREKLEETMAYLGSSQRKRADLEQLMITYLLYPLVMRSDDEETYLLIKKLILTREERDYIKRNITDKILQFGLVQLNEILECESYEFSNRLEGCIVNRFVILTIECIMVFIKTNLKTGGCHRTLPICFGMLNKLIDTAPSLSDKTLLLRILDGAQTIIETIKTCTDENKHIVIMLQRVITAAHRKCQIDNPPELHKKIVAALNRTIDIAFQFDDHDILNEFASLLVDNPFAKDLSRDETDTYVRLIWVHMYKKGRDSRHQEYLGYIAQLLVKIDLDIEAPIMEKYGIRRHHQIPQILGDILKNYAAVIPIVESALDVLVAETLVKRPPPHDEAVGYLCLLDSPNLPNTVQHNLINLTQGICCVALGEIGESNRINAIRLINALTEEMITNTDDCLLLAKKLVDTDILETIYRIITGPLFPIQAYEKAKEKLCLIKNSVIAKLEDPQEMIEYLLRSRCSRMNNEVRKEILSNNIKAISEFYSRKSDYFRNVETIPSVVMKAKYDLKGMIGEIVNHDKIRHGDLDCY